MEVLNKKSAEHSIVKIQILIEIIFFLKLFSLIKHGILEISPLIQIHTAAFYFN